VKAVDLVGSWRARQVQRATNDEEADEDRRLVESHRSPGLKEVFASTARHKDLRILDLGPSVAGNFEFYTDFASRVRFVDLFGHDRHIDVAQSMGFKARVHDLEEITAKHAGTFDVGLAWDVFNYVPEDQARMVVQALARLCRPGASLLAIIVEADTMPARPSTYRIINEESLAYQLEGTEIRGGPQLPPAAVERLLAGFAVEHTFVLRHGVREYVAVKKEEGI
jgi:hypothetical protein